MPKAIARANARSLPADRLRGRLVAAVDRLISALDALDAPEEDIEDNRDAEAFADDAEPSLGSTNMVDHNAAWQNTFSDTDLELDEGESGIADADGFAEQTKGEPSLGSLDAEIDQDRAWHPAIHAVADGEATQTLDDFGSSGVSGPEWLAREARQQQTRADLQAFLERRQSSTTEGRASQ